MILPAILGGTIGVATAASITNPEALALISRMDTAPSSDVQSYIENTIVALQNAGIWNKLDALWMVGGTQQASLLNWKEDAFNGTANGTVSFTAYRGFTGNGTDFYISTGWKPDGATNYQKESAMYGGVYQDMLGTDNHQRTMMGMGWGGTGTPRLLINQNHSGTNGCEYMTNNNTFRVYTDSSLLPKHVTSTRSGTNMRTFHDGVQKDSTTTTPEDLTNTAQNGLVLYAFMNQTAGVSRYGKCVMSAHYVGGHLTPSEVLELVYILNNNYLYPIGAEAEKVPEPAEADIAMSPLNPVQNDVVTYTLSMDVSSGQNPTGSLDVTWSGDFLDADFNTGFVAALTTAAAATTGVTFDGVNTLTFDSTFAGTLQWSHTLTAATVNDEIIAVALSASSTIKIGISHATAVTGTPTVAALPAKLRGVNLSGAEFGGFAFYQVDGSNNFNSQEVTYYTSRDANVIRLPMLWQRLQETLFGNLDIVGDGTGDAEKYKAVTDGITGLSTYCVVDCHNYGQRPVDGTTRRLYDDELPLSAFIDFWDKLTDHLGTNQYFIFDLMNEAWIESGISGITKWYKAATSVVAMLRAKGIFNRIHVSGGASAKSFVSEGAAALFVNFIDPVDNTVIDLHDYLDAAASGVEGSCSVDSNNRFDAAITWADSNSKKICFGEFAAGDPTVSGQEQCAIELPAALDAMEASSNVVCYTAWGGGEHWGNYHFALEPTPRTDPDTEYMNMYQPYMALNGA